MFRARTAGVRDYIPHFTPTEINMKKTSSWMFAAIIGIVSAGLTAGCGSSSSNNTGTAGRGGTTGTGGSTGTGGTIGANCAAGLTMAPAMALITDFSDTMPGTGTTVF